MSTGRRSLIAAAHGWLRLAPRLFAACAVSVTSLLLFAAQHCGSALDLTHAAGFGDAVAHLVAAPPDFVVLWPPDAAGALEALPPQLHAADAVPADPPERRRYNRLAVIGPAGFADPPELADADAAPRREFGDVEVGIYSYPARDRVLVDLRDALARARVSLTGPQYQVSCDRKRDDGGWDCPGRPQWNRVSPTTLRVEGQDWPSVWVHPVEAHDMVIDLGDQPLGDRLEIDAALSDDAAATPGGAAVDVVVEIRGADPKNVLTKSLRRGNSVGVTTLSVPLPVPGDRGTVTLRIRTPRDARRHFAINLRVVQAPREGPTP